MTNTFFQNKTCHKVSWRHTRSKYWHQLDMIIIRRGSLNNVCITRDFHSADCNTDHSLITSKVKLRPKKLYYSNQKSQPHINTCKNACPEKNQKFVECVEETLTHSQEHNTEDRGRSLRTSIYSAAVLMYGKRQRKNADWFEANITKMEPVLNTKRTALINYKRDPSQKNLQALRAACRKAQQTGCRCANHYWLQLSGSIQQASDTGNIRSMYQGIKQADKEDRNLEIQNWRKHHRREQADGTMG